MFRIGQSSDIHRFKEGDHIVLGGVNIPHTKGMEAHSDGDALCHAIGEAILGALALGDLGHHFPDTDPKYKGIDSLLMLISSNVVPKKPGVLPELGTNLTPNFCALAIASKLR